jgi:hypothetical protein
MEFITHYSSILLQLPSTKPYYIFGAEFVCDFPRDPTKRTLIYYFSLHMQKLQKIGN